MSRVAISKTKGAPNEVIADGEHSYVVVDDPNKAGRLKKFLLDHGKKYGQEMVLWKPHNRENASLLYTKTVSNGKTYHPGDEQDLGKFHPNRIGEYHSKLFRRPGLDTFENVEVEYKFMRNVSPLSMGRHLLVDF